MDSILWYHHTKPSQSDLRVYSVVSPYKTHPVRPTCLQCGITIQNPPSQTYVFTVWYHHTKPSQSDLRVYSVVSPYKTHPVRPTCLQCGITIQNPPCQTYVLFTVWYHHTKPSQSDLRVYSVVSPYKTHPVRPTCLQCGITIQNPPSQTYVFTVWYHHTKPTQSDLRVVYSVVSPYKTHPVRPTCCLQCGITIQNPPSQTYVFTVWYHHTKPTQSDLRVVYSVVSPYKTLQVRPTCCLQCGITIQNPPSQTYVLLTVWYHHTKPTLSDLRVVYSVVSPYKTHPVRPTCCLQCSITIQNPPCQTYVLFTVWYHHTKPSQSDLRVVYSVVSPYKTHPVRPTCCLQCGITIQNPPSQTYVLFTVWYHHTKPSLSDLRVVYSVVSPYKTHPVRPTCCLQCGITIQNPPSQTYVFTVWYHHTKPTQSDLRVYSVVSPYKTLQVRPTCC